jgi:hypothetical protein
MKPTLDSYRDERTEFLSNVADTLSRDERFVAAWLTGSLGRNEADSVSDIDLSLVVQDAYSSSLCMRLDQVGPQTSPERYALFSQFGAVALIHENNNNAPEGGTFTFILYADSAIMVDWILIPQSKAKRLVQSKLLFDKTGIPVTPPAQADELEKRQKFVSEKWAFFWMMTAVTIKYVLRNDGVFVAHWIEYLHSLIREMEREISGQPRSYIRGSLSQLQATREKQIESLKQLCQRMQELKSAVAEFTGTKPMMPITEIETLFSFAQSEIANHKS